MSLVKVLILVGMAASVDDIEIPELVLPPVQMTGVSSWYGGGSGDNGMHGKIMANGKPFDPSRRVCATRTVPLGTMILIEDLDTGNRAWCRGVDRGPFGALDENGNWVLKLKKSDPGVWRGISDMSKGTAEALGVDLNKGMYNVSIRYWDVPRRRFNIRMLR